MKSFSRIAFKLGRFAAGSTLESSTLEIGTFLFIPGLATFPGAATFELLRGVTTAHSVSASGGLSPVTRSAKHIAGSSTELNSRSSSDPLPLLLLPATFVAALPVLAGALISLFAQTKMRRSLAHWLRRDFNRLQHSICIFQTQSRQHLSCGICCFGVGWCNRVLLHSHITYSCLLLYPRFTFVSRFY
jgi:hypothetical protein